MPTSTQAKAARSEASGQPKSIDFKGETFHVPAEIPFAFAAYVQEGELIKALRGLLEDADFDRFLATRPSMSEFQSFIEDLETVYGVSEGG